MKRPDESLSEYVKRKVAEEGPQTDEQAEAGFIDGNAGYEGKAVTFGLGKKPKKKPVDKP